MSRRPILPLAFAVEGALLLLAFGLGAATGAPPFARARFDASGVALGTAAGVALLAALLPAMRSDWPPFARLSETVRKIVREWFGDASIAEIAVVSALAGLAEEALFRGVLQTALTGAWGVVPGVLGAAVLFGLAHAVTLTYAVVATAVGAGMGVLLVASGDLAAPILAHAVYDFLALVWLARIDLDPTPSE